MEGCVCAPYFWSVLCLLSHQSSFIVSQVSHDRMMGLYDFNKELEACHALVRMKEEGDGEPPRKRAKK